MAKIYDAIAISDDDDGNSKNPKPLRKIPDITGVPLFTAMKDRVDFFYTQGQYKYFETRVARAGSTVLRMNMIPGPFCADPKVVALCDSVSFTTLFDPSKVDKSDALTGSYFPSLGFTGGHRICAYLDPSDPTHTKIKQVFLNAQAARKSTFIPTLTSCFNALFDEMDAQLASTGAASFRDPSEAAAFDFVCESLVGTKPADGLRAAFLKYIFLQFHPIMTLGLPKAFEEAFLHAFPFPSFVARNNNKVLYKYFSSAGSWILDDAVRAGIDRDEACHHLIFSWVVNGFLGCRVFLLRLFKWVVSAGPKIHARLAAEVRAAGEDVITCASLEKMELVKSAVYEAFRIDPPVQVQYGRARRDLVLESHEARFEVKGGEMLCGFQPMATRDGRVFERAEEYVADRFVGDGGKELLKYVVWSNGPETGKAEAGNKVCAGKEVGMMVGRMMLVVMFGRYDEIVGEVGETMEDLEVKVTEMKKKKNLPAV